MGMCGCKASAKKPVRVKKSKRDNIAIDKWQAKHIEILKNKFKRILKASKFEKSQSLDRKSFLEMFNDLKDLPKDVVISMFNFFDIDKSGKIDFREFCTGLSLICLSSTEEKIKVIFQLFDLDNDNILNYNEFENLLRTSLIGFRKISKGPGGTADEDWMQKQIESLFNDKSQGLGFDEFLVWARENLNVYKLLNTFEIVPSPRREKFLITQILKEYEMQVGDTFYVLSHRWWESWKHFVNSKSSNQENEMRQSEIEEEEEDFEEIVQEYLIAIRPFDVIHTQRGRNMSIHRNNRKSNGKLTNRGQNTPYAEDIKDNSSLHNKHENRKDDDTDRNKVSSKSKSKGKTPKDLSIVDASYDTGGIKRQINNLRKQETPKSSMYQKNKFTTQQRPYINNGSSDEINSKLFSFKISLFSR